MYWVDGALCLEGQRSEARTVVVGNGLESWRSLNVLVGKRSADSTLPSKTLSCKSQGILSLCKRLNNHV